MATHANSLSQRLGAIPNEDDIQDLARKIEDRQPVGSHPKYSVIAAEKCFLWVMDIPRSENGPLGTVEDYVWKRVSEKRGSSLAYAALGKTWYST